VYLGCEGAGVVATGWLWLTRGADPARYAERNFRLQCWWAGTLFAAARRLFALRLEVEGDELAAKGPVIVLLRHASVGDTLLPVALLSAPHGLRLRYVLKRELLWDPCLDIVGQRLPNAFVRRGSTDAAREIATVRALADGLGPGDGVLLYPEGTRFSPGRRKAALDKLAATPALLPRAEALTHVLPPRLGGVLALLDHAPDVDVVFCGHVGFDGVRRLGDLWNGALVGRALRVTLWRCPRASIPTDREGRVDWLYEQWARRDRWVAAAGAQVMHVPVAGVTDRSA
jgi:1-acyl-sn-glycerol-3-phosphate acyltransferase